MSQSQDTKKQLEQILEKEEYQVYYEEEQNLFQYILESIGKWVLEMFQKLFPGLRITDQTMNVTMFIIGFIGLVVIILLVWLIKRNLTSNKSGRSLTQPLYQEDELEWSPKKHLDEAFSFKQKGDLQQATRHVFLAMLLYFDSQEWIEARMWKTNWDYYEELKKVDAKWANQFYEIAQRFDEVIYGEREVSQQEYETYHRQALEWLEAHEESS